MNLDTQKVEFSGEDIAKVSKIIYEEYKSTLQENNVPRVTVKNLSKLLSYESITEENKLIALECASRIKYEILSAINADYSTSLNRYYFKFKKNDFIIKMAMAYILGYNKSFTDYLPNIIRTSLNNAYFKTKNSMQEEKSKKF